MSTGRTLYHVVFAELLKERAPPGFRVVPEHVLATEPQQADFLLLRQEGTPRHDEEARTLRRLWSMLPGDTIVEYKSPTRPVRRGDVGRLLGYGAQYWSLEAKRLQTRHDLALVLAVASVTPTLSDELAALDWRVEPLGGGYYALGSHPFRGILAVIDEISAAEQDELLELVGHRTMQTRGQDLWLVTHTVYGPKRTEMEKLEGYEELVKKAFASMPDEMRLEGMTPERRAAGLSDEERFLLLSDESLRRLPPDLIDSLPEAIREQIRRRIATH